MYMDFPVQIFHQVLLLDVSQMLLIEPFCI